MSTDDRERWTRRHQNAAALKPRRCVLEVPPARASGAVALDLACGQGRHTSALLRAGYRVVAMDIASTALHHARASVAAASDVSDDVLFLQADTDAWPLAGEAFDLIVQVDFLDRGLFPMLHHSLRPGGLLLIETFLDQGVANAQGPSRPEFLLAPGELLHAFREYEVLRYDEVRGDTARATFLGRKHDSGASKAKPERPAHEPCGEAASTCCS